MNDTNTEMTTTKAGKMTTLRDELGKMGQQIQIALPKHVSAERFLRVIFTQVQVNPALLECTRTSLLAAVMKAAERGLMPDGRMGALVPYRNTRRNIREAQWIPMYQGLIDLARRSGEVDDVFPATICEHDEFSYELGFARNLVHKPKLDGPRGKPIAYYAVVELSNGKKTFGPGPMTMEEVERIRKRSKASGDGPWVTDFESMAWKTVIKRVLKFCPQSDELRAAIEDDNQFDIDPGELVGAEDTAASLDDEIKKEAASRGTGRPAVSTPEAQGEHSPSTEQASASGTDAAGAGQGAPGVAAHGMPWPQWDAEQKAWIDSAGEIFDKEAHGWNARDKRPSVRQDGTFKARRGTGRQATHTDDREPPRTIHDGGQRVSDPGQVAQDGKSPDANTVMKWIQEAADADDIGVCEDAVRGLSENERYVVVQALRSKKKTLGLLV